MPRRFAPRNDMQKLAGCLRVQERAAMANSQPLSYSPEVLLSAMPCRKEYGLPRRFAPRNDMQKLAGCLRVQERGAMANSQPLSYSPKVLLSAMPCRKENGLPRRFAPRNDMQKLAGCLRVQERAAMANLQLFRICPKYCFSFCPTARRTDCPVASLLAMTMGEVLAPVDTPCLLHTLRAPRPCTRAHVPAFCMSLRTSAHTGVAIRFPRRKAWQVGTTSGKFAAFSYLPKVLLSAMPCRKENGLSRRFAPRNDRGGASLRTGARWEPGRTCAARRRRCSGVT